MWLTVANNLILPLPSYVLHHSSTHPYADRPSIFPSLTHPIFLHTHSTSPTNNKYLSSKIEVYQYQEAHESEIITFVNITQILVQFAMKLYKHVLKFFMCMYTQLWTWPKKLIWLYKEIQVFDRSEYFKVTKKNLISPW